jgi:hypothetical protein
MEKIRTKVEVVVVNNPDSHQAIEVVLERPNLYVAMLQSLGEIIGQTDGVFLFRGTDRVLVRCITTCPWILPERRQVGYVRQGSPGGPQYTGPIDDEMMANILIYGG